MGGEKIVSELATTILAAHTPLSSKVCYEIWLEECEPRAEQLH